VGVAVCWV